MKKAKKLVKASSNLQRSQSSHSSYKLANLPQERPERDWAEIGKKRSTGYPPTNQIAQEISDDGSFEEYKIEIEFKIEQFTATIKSQQEYIETEEKKFRAESSKTKKLEQKLLKANKLITIIQEHLGISEQENFNIRSQLDSTELENAENLRIIENLRQESQKLELELENMKNYNSELSTIIKREAVNEDNIILFDLDTIEEAQEDLTSQTDAFQFSSDEEYDLQNLDKAQLISKIKELELKIEELRQESETSEISNHQPEQNWVNLAVANSGPDSPEIVRRACEDSQYNSVGEHSASHINYLRGLELPIDNSLQQPFEEQEHSEQPSQQDPEQHGQQGWLQWVIYYVLLVPNFLHKTLENIIELFK